MAKKRQRFQVKTGRPPTSRWERLAPPAADPVSAVFRAEYLTAHAILDERGGVCAEGVTEVCANAQGYLTHVVSRSIGETSPLKVACHAGCSWCCCIAVSAWPMELLLIGRTLAEQVPAEKLSALTTKLRQAVQEGDRQRSVGDGTRRVQCPLLDGNRCSIYPARPAACVGWNADNAEDCRAYAEGDERFALARTDPTRMLAAQAVPEAAAEALKDRGGPLLEDCARRGPGSPVDLHAGLLAVLEIGADRATEAWLAGAAFLDSARSRRQNLAPEMRDALVERVREGKHQ